MFEILLALDGPDLQGFSDDVTRVGIVACLYCMIDIADESSLSFTSILRTTPMSKLLVCSTGYGNSPLADNLI